MEETKLFDSELRVMDIIWDKEPITAKEISEIASETIGWNKNTTYTVIKKLIAKKVVKRTEPRFTCTALVGREDVQKAETQNLIDKFYQGSKKLFLASFVQENLSEEEFVEFMSLIDKKR